MGKLIEFDPSRRRKKEETKKSDEKKVQDINIGEGLKNFIKQMGEYDPGNLLVELVLAGVNVGDRIEEIIKNTGDPSPKIYSERKEIVCKYSNPQLIQEFANSNYSQWHKDPAFYRAVVNEVQERIKMITEKDE